MKKGHITAILHNDGDISFHPAMYEANILERYDGYGQMTGQMTLSEARETMHSWREKFWEWLPKRVKL